MELSHSVGLVNTLSVALTDRDGYQEVIWKNNLLITPMVARDQAGSVLFHLTIPVVTISDQARSDAKALLVSKGFHEEGFNLSHS